jgi:hypothetical protein
MRTARCESVSGEGNQGGKEGKRTLSHLVSSLSATDVDDDIRVRELRHRLRDDRLSATECSGNRRRSSLNTGEEGVEDALTGEERVVGLELLAGGTGSTDGPDLEEGVGRLLAFEFGLEDNVLRGARSELTSSARNRGKEGVRRRCTIPSQRCV